MDRNIVAVYLSLGVLSYVLFRIFSAVHRTRQSIPGPKIATYTRLWYIRSVWRGDFHLVNIALHRQFANNSVNTFYAPIIRLAPNLYSISEPDPKVYAVSSKMPKSTWYDGWRTPSLVLPTLFTEQRIAFHNTMRKKVQHMYSLSSLVTYESYVDECLDIFEARLNEMAKDGLHGVNGAVNIGYWFQCYAADVITSITYSKRLGLLDRGEDIGNLVAALDRNMVYSSLAGIYAWTSPWLWKLLLPFAATGPASRKQIGLIHRKMEQGGRIDAPTLDGTEAAEAGAKEGFRPKAFMSKLHDMQRDGQHSITESDFLNVGLSNITAGSDTTGIGLSAVLYYLIRNPLCLVKLREEISSATDGVQRPADHISFQDTQKMQYLQAIIKESLRMHPPVGLPLWRVVGKGGAEVCNQWLPEGSEVGVNAWVVHYDRSIWGEDVEHFRPERWIEAVGDDQRLRTMESHFVPFGLGSRTCIGRHVSYLEMCKAVPRIIQRFDFELLQPGTPWKCENFWFVKPQDFFVKVKLRSG